MTQIWWLASISFVGYAYIRYSYVMDNRIRIYWILLGDWEWSFDLDIGFIVVFVFLLVLMPVIPRDIEFRQQARCVRSENATIGLWYVVIVYVFQGGK